MKPKRSKSKVSLNYSSCEVYSNIPFKCPLCLAQFTGHHTCSKEEKRPVPDRPTRLVKVIAPRATGKSTAALPPITDAPIRSSKEITAETVAYRAAFLARKASVPSC